MTTESTVREGAKLGEADGESHAEGETFAALSLPEFLIAGPNGAVETITLHKATATTRIGIGLKARRPVPIMHCTCFSQGTRKRRPRPVGV